MFHVEHMFATFFRYFFLKCSTWNTISIGFISFLLISIAACEKKDPKPELKDNIYQDMVAQQAEAERLLNEMDAKIEDIKKSMLESDVQSGMRKKAAKQIIEFQKTKDKLAQQSIYWKIRTFERLKLVRLKAGRQTEPYKADQTEWEIYNSEKKLRMAKNSWDLKARFRETGFEYDPILMGESPAEAPKKAPPTPAGGGGH